jgi:hypothetical protein
MYFATLPAVRYTDLENANLTSTVVLTNILTRSSFLRDIMNNTSVYYDYQIKDNETPEIIADKLYGDVNRHWIVLMFNQILDPFYSFPLTGTQLDDYITNKYQQSLALSQTTIHHYEQRITRTTYLNNMPQESNTDVVIIASQQLNMTTGILETTPFLPGTADTSLSAGSTTESFGSGITTTTDLLNVAVSNYTYEQNENEKKRSIKLLDKAYVPTVENEFRRLMRNGT